jgi:hypothetical protein
MSCQNIDQRGRSLHPIHTGCNLRTGKEPLYGNPEFCAGRGRWMRGTQGCRGMLLQASRGERSMPGLYISLLKPV